MTVQDDRPVPVEHEVEVRAASNQRVILLCDGRLYPLYVGQTLHVPCPCTEEAPDV